VKTLMCLLAFALVATSLAAQERLGFHVRAWVQWENQRIDLGEGYVGGPHGLGFTVSARLESTVFTVKVKPVLAGDSTRYGASIETRVAVSDSQALTPLFAMDDYTRSVAVGRGEAAQLLLPFHPEPQETATLILRIEGPFEPRPTDSGGWMDRIVTEPRGVYYRNVAYRAAVAVTPNVCVGALAVRLAVGSAPGGTDALACEDQSTTISIPGISGRWVVQIARPPSASRRQRCVGISSAPGAGTRGGYVPRSWGTWCPPEEDRWSPASMRLSTGETIRAQLIP
jgi:hypothetical protein